MSCCGGVQLVLSSTPLNEPLNLVVGDDYVRALKLVDPVTGVEQVWPGGQYLMELSTSPLKTVWQWHASGVWLSVKVESEEVAKIPDRTRYHLKFLPAGELDGGQTLYTGLVRLVR